MFINVLVIIGILRQYGCVMAYPMYSLNVLKFFKFKFVEDGVGRGKRVEGSGKIDIRFKIAEILKSN